MENINRIKRYIEENKSRIGIGLDDDFSVEFLAQGEYNKNYTIISNGDKYVFRLNMGSQLGLSDQISYEYKGLLELEESGVTPKPLYLDDEKDFFDGGLLIMEFLEGRPLIYEKDLEKAARIFARIHSLEINDSRREHFIIEEELLTCRIKEGSKLLENVWDSELVDIKVKRIFYSLIDYLEKNKMDEEYFLKDKWSVINNTEVNSNNFIIGDRDYLIDWEKPVISDPCQDLTQFLAPTTTLWKTDYLFDRERREEFFKIYTKNLTKGDRDIRDRVEIYNPYLLLRAFAWSAYAFVEYHNPDKKIKNEDTFKVIKRFLEIDFMEKVLGDYIRI